ncbi:MAG: hypothetical protein SFU83_00125 [Meiothermus sp.]|nr:hypothetical protein [Meiothermus sp.]
MRCLSLLTVSSSLALMLLLGACSSPASATSPNPTPFTPNPTSPNPTDPAVPQPPVPPPNPGMTNAEAKQVAMALWHNQDLTKHPKGSCAGCHGADFFDLARIGSTDADLTRRAVIDGATPAEAAALIQAVKAMRTEMRLPAANARTFRPFQPGGEVLLSGLTDPPHLRAVKRDIEFGRRLERLLPTLMGGRIDSLEKAQKARDELLDLARGTNTAGANPNRLNIRKLPTGIIYPLWSADSFHGAAEGTFNDWVADVAHDAKPERKTEWLALQNAYLANPSTENFWKMYHAVATGGITTTPLLGTCTMDGLNPSLACGAVDDFNQHKFLSALIGQHLMRQEALGLEDGFTQNALAFQYLDTDPRFAFINQRKDPEFLPADMWEIGDRGRVMLDDSSRTGSFRENLRKLGYPEFVLNSIDPNRTEAQEQHALRLAWFWIGFSFDPSFARMHASNATKVGEYMVGTLIQERMFIHNAFAQNMRLVARGFLPEANVRSATRPSRVTPVKPEFLMNYSYFIGYGREILDKEWSEDRRAGVTFPQALKDEQGAIWGRFVSNGFRMSLYLQMAEWPGLSTASQTHLRSTFVDTVDAGGNTRYGTLRVIERSLEHYNPATVALEEELVNQMRDLAGIPRPTY